MNAPSRVALTHGGRPMWTSEEDRIIRRRYPRLRRLATAALEWAALLRALPGRTRAAVMTRATRLGCNLRRAWTPAERATLRRLWPDTGWRTIRQALHGRSLEAIRHEAARLGLERRWQGYVSLFEAGKLLGYHREALRKILDEEGVQVSKRGGRHEDVQNPQWVVDVDAARDAVTRWLSRDRETASAAAKRYGVATSQMRIWLREAGLLAPSPGPGNRTPVRIEVAAIDAALVRLATDPPAHGRRRRALEEATAALRRSAA